MKNYEYFLYSNGNNAYSLDYQNHLLNKYVLKDGKYNIENSELLKGLKSVNKVFDFNLQIEYADKSVKSIHKFADGVAEITLALTDEDLKTLDKNKIKVLYYNEETKKYEALETSVDGNNITFKTSHFSKFIVAEIDNAGQSVNDITASVKTGDNNSSRNILLFGVFALLSLGGITIMGYSKLRKNKLK